MSSAAAFAINNGLDPFIGSDWQPRKTSNSLYDSDDKSSRTRSFRNKHTKKSKSFSNFQLAWSFSKSVAPSTLKRDGEGFIVTFD